MFFYAFVCVPDNLFESTIVTVIKINNYYNYKQET